MSFGLAIRITPAIPVPHSIAGLLALVIAGAALLAPLLLSAQSTLSRDVTLQIIVVDSPADAQKIVDRSRKGADFAALAREKSTDATASDGGYMGRVDPATLRSELRDALKGIAPGQVTGPLKIPSGYAILKVLPSNGTRESASANPARILPLAATGEIHYSPNVGGENEADLAFRNFSKPAGWSQDLKEMCEIRKKSYSVTLDQLEKNQLRMNAEGLAHGTPLDNIEAHYALANLYSYKGTMDKAVAEWERAYQIATAQLPEAMPQLEEVLGIAYLHKSEMENDVYRSPGDRCIFPPQPGMRYQKTGDSEKSVEYLTKYLDRKPDASDVKWLLNLAYMTLGGYPGKVPQKYLIAPSLFESAESVGCFVDVAPATGINTYDESGGIIVDDFDDDGLLDVVLSDYDQCAPLHFFHNNGDGTFTDRTAQAGLADQFGGLNLLQTDYNNDGCLDILVLRRMGVSATQITAAQQLQRHIHRRNRSQRPGGTGHRYPDGRLG